MFSKKPLQTYRVYWKLVHRMKVNIDKNLAERPELKPFYGDTEFVLGMEVWSEKNDCTLVKKLRARATEIVNTFPQLEARIIDIKRSDDTYVNWLEVNNAHWREHVGSFRTCPERVECLSRAAA